MSKKYYVLAVREHGRWGVAFGAYDRQDVTFERDTEIYCDRTRRADTRILVTGDTQQEIDCIIAALNA